MYRTNNNCLNHIDSLLRHYHILGLKSVDTGFHIFFHQLSSRNWTFEHKCMYYIQFNFHLTKSFMILSISQFYKQVCTCFPALFVTQLKPRLLLTWKFSLQLQMLPGANPMNNDGYLGTPCKRINLSIGWCNSVQLS